MLFEALFKKNFNEVHKFFVDSHHPPAFESHVRIMKLFYQAKQETTCLNSML